MDQIRLKNSLGINIYLIPTAKDNQFILKYGESISSYNTKTIIDIMTRKVEMIEPYGGPILQVRKDNIKSIEIIDKEDGGPIHYLEQEGKDVEWLIKFNENGVPKEIIFQEIYNG